MAKTHSTQDFYEAVADYSTQRNLAGTMQTSERYQHAVAFNTDKRRMNPSTWADPSARFPTVEQTVPVPEVMVYERAALKDSLFPSSLDALDRDAAFGVAAHRPEFHQRVPYGTPETHALERPTESLPAMSTSSLESLERISRDKRVERGSVDSIALHRISYRRHKRI